MGPSWHEMLLAWLLPTRCSVCAAVGKEALCAQCRAKLGFIVQRCARCGRIRHTAWASPDCGHCSGENIGVERARSIAVYDKTARALLTSFKYERRMPAGRVLSELLTEALTGNGVDLFGTPALGLDAVLPVPLHSSRRRQRRFNQSEVLATAAAERLGLPMLGGTLLRLRDTQSQVGLSANQRRVNLRGAFGVPEKLQPRVTGKALLLVDDLMTTGSTLKACALALKRGGAARVLGLTVFSTMEKHFQADLPGPLPPPL